MISLFKSLVVDLEKKITAMSDTEYSPGVFSLAYFLVGLSYVYKAGAGIRLGLYRRGILKQKRLSCPVVSIGNITAGGSGKTPMTLYLAELLVDMGRRPVVVSRGYGGRSKQVAAVVGDGRQVFMDAEAAGDEPYMMARRKRFPVVVGKQRYEAGRLAIESFNPDIIILDDGFQHMALARDLNLVLLDHDRPLGNGRILPAGRLRETPAMARERIGAVVLTRCPQTFFEDAGREMFPGVLGNRFGGIPFFYTRHQAFLSGYYPDHSQTEKVIGGTLESLTGRSAVLFSGIAQNKSFKKTVATCGIKVLAHLEFVDHYSYNRVDFQQIRQQAEALGADLILTTEKDWVKLEHDFSWGRDLAVIGIKIGFQNQELFYKMIQKLIRDRINKQ